MESYQLWNFVQNLLIKEILLFNVNKSGSFHNTLPYHLKDDGGWTAASNGDIYL